jgi:hypothetical protein
MWSDVWSFERCDDVEIGEKTAVVRARISVLAPFG